MTDIVEFIKARLDDDERLARAASVDDQPAVWAVEHSDDWANERPDQLDPRCAAGECDCRVVQGVIDGRNDGMRIYDEGGHDGSDAEHIARHDPARVLREVEAKQQLLLIFASLDQSADVDAGPTATELVRTLALPYSDHPDFREEWRP